MKLIISENCRGFLFQNGKFRALLGPGKYFVLKASQNEEGHRTYIAPFGKTVEVVACEGALSSVLAPRETLLADPRIAKETASVAVGFGERLIRFVNGKFAGTFGPGTHVFWNVNGENEFFKEDVSTYHVRDDFPVELFSFLPTAFYSDALVDGRMHGLLFVDGKFEKLLPPGRYYFWAVMHEVSVRTVPACLAEENLVGQEILTADKVPLRLNCVCEYLITDPVGAGTALRGYSEGLHTAVQIALREFVGKYRLDEILSLREEISAYLLGRVKEREADLFLDVKSVAVKDIILPGEIRAIMNTVLAAEKQAQANVIARREEVASTRSLLNTAKLMDENATLYKLKELEYLERICAHVSALSLGGDAGILERLTAALNGKKN